MLCDWTRQTLNVSELKEERPAEPDLIHTSCRSESSNISLVVLDKASLCPNAPHVRLESGMHFLGETPALVKPLRLSPRLASSCDKNFGKIIWNWGCLHWVRRRPISVLSKRPRVEQRWNRSELSGLSLVLKKDGLWLNKTDTQPEQTQGGATGRARLDTHLLWKWIKQLLAWSF